MQSRGVRLAMVAALAALAVVLFVVLSDDGSEDEGGEPTVAAGETTSNTTATGQEPQESQEPQFAVIRMRDGEPVGGVRELTYATGDQVRIEVVLDEPQEDVHIHGYGIERLNASGRVRFEFPARLDGIFELEAHGPSGDVVLAQLRVEPS